MSEETQIENPMVTFVENVERRYGTQRELHEFALAYDEAARAEANARESLRRELVLPAVARVTVKDGAERAAARLERAEKQTAQLESDVLRMEVEAVHAARDASPEGVARRAEIRAHLRTLNHVDRFAAYLEAAHAGRADVVFAVNEDPLEPGMGLAQDTQQKAWDLLAARLRPAEAAALEQRIGLRKMLGTSTRYQLGELRRTWKIT